jgi:hypothetical protein
MSDRGRNPLPRFGPPSRELRDAVRMIHRERLAKLTAVRSGDWNLNEPRTPPSPELDAAMKLVAQTGNQRFEALYNFFSLNRELPRSGAALAYRLACELIPGFDPYYIPPRGRPHSVRNDHGLLVQTIQDAKGRKPGLSIKAVCTIISKTDARFKGKTWRELQAAYYRFMAEDAKIREKIDKYRDSGK